MEGREHETNGVLPHRAASGGPKKAKATAKKTAGGQSTP